MKTLAEIQEKYPLREYLDQLLGPPKRRRSLYDERQCPFHDDHVASMLVYEQRCTCKAGCSINGREYGSIFDFVQQYMGAPSLLAAIEALGETPSPPTFERRVEKVTPLSWKDVQKTQYHPDLATAYFVGRGLNERTVHERKLGVMKSWPHTSESDGRTYRCPHYTIPDIAFGVVRNIYLRRDDVNAQHQTELLDASLRERYLEWLSYDSMGIQARERGLIDHLFGGRYKRIPGGIRRNLVFNAERAWERVQHDGEWGWFSRDLPYLLVHEGQIKALAMEDCLDGEYGYPSVSCKGAPGLGMLKGVRELIIVADNDDDKTNPDGTIFNPGNTFAQRAVEASGRLSGIRIIHPPYGFNGADDVCTQGDVVRWMENEGLEPIKLRRIVA